MADNNELVPVAMEMARLNITYNRMQGDLPDLVPYDSSDADIKQMASESIRDGYVPGIDAVPNADFTNFVVDRFPARGDIPFNRISLRPKTEFGAGLAIGSSIIEKDGKYTFVIHPTNEEAEAAKLPIISGADAGVWFPTIDEAKAAGSQMLKHIMDGVRAEGGNVLHTGDIHHRDCRSYPHCEDDLEGCKVAQRMKGE